MVAQKTCYIIYSQTNIEDSCVTTYYMYQGYHIQYKSYCSRTLYYESSIFKDALVYCRLKHITILQYETFIDNIKTPAAGNDPVCYVYYQEFMV